MYWSSGSNTNLHSFDDFFGEKKFSWLPFKNKVADENLHSQRHTNFLVKLQCLVLELVFRRQSEEFRQMKTGQYNIHKILQFPVGLFKINANAKSENVRLHASCCCNCCRTRKHTRFGLIIAQNSHLSSLHTRLHGPSRPKWASGLYYALVGKYICTSVLDMKIH